ncbi:uncharacterized protein [Palaemon carinicauda]|uniref:uncharacterized protein n=1 Tax=Palaemon carinicauda TaxID=392227 RepID=UPI0035B57A58
MKLKDTEEKCDKNSLIKIKERDVKLKEKDKTSDEEPSMTMEERDVKLEEKQEKSNEEPTMTTAKCEVKLEEKRKATKSNQWQWQNVRTKWKTIREKREKQRRTINDSCRTSSRTRREEKSNEVPSMTLAECDAKLEETEKKND